MRTILITVFVLVLISPSFGQTVSEPLQLNSHVLVNSAGLPEEYLLFVPDTATQIFFNPARAASYKGNFVYVNYFSDYSGANNAYLSASLDYSVTSVISPTTQVTLFKTTSAPFNFPTISEDVYTSSRNPSFSVASLIDQGDVKWLFSLSNGIYITDSERNTIIDNERYVSNSIETVKESTNQNNTADGSATAFKISRVTNNGSNNMSLGVWGVFFNSNNSTTYYGLQDGKRIYPGSGNAGSVSYSTAVVNQNINRDNKRVAAGFELALNNKSYDFIGRVGYQLNKSPQQAFSEKSNYSADTSFTFNPPDFSSTSTYSLVNGKLEGNSNGIDFYTYYSNDAGFITPNDKFFVSFYAFHIAGDKSYSGETYEQRLYQNSGGNNSQDTSYIIKSNSLGSRNNGILLSVGYALRLNLGDLNILSGLKILGIYRDDKDVDAGITTTSSSFIEFTYIKKSTEFIIPVYLNYSPEEWISLYAGINIIYAYSNEKYDITDKQFVYNSSLNISNVTRKRFFDDTYWRSKKFSYAGFELRHPSGLRIQTYFDESFSNIRDWNISVGYHF